MAQHVLKQRYHQGCASALALELPKSCVEPSMWCHLFSLPSQYFLCWAPWILPSIDYSVYKGAAVARVCQQINALSRLEAIVSKQIPHHPSPTDRKRCWPNDQSPQPFLSYCSSERKLSIYSSFKHNRLIHNIHFLLRCSDVPKTNVRKINHKLKLRSHSLLQFSGKNIVTDAGSIYLLRATGRSKILSPIFNIIGSIKGCRKSLVAIGTLKKTCLYQKSAL